MIRSAHWDDKPRGGHTIVAIDDVTDTRPYRGRI